jgi:ubiquinone/menaquinone biosynthesis C-methylase UbiE
MNVKPSDDHWHNRTAWDRLAKKQDRLATPARDVDFNDPLASVDGMGWLGGDVRGKRLLCLAAGGGRQGPIYAAAGAEVTVVDLSPAMLELDREVSLERQLKIRTVEASMDDLSMLADRSFDIVIHPVSTCYVPDVRPVYLEVARIMVAGGIYVSQHKQPTSLQSDIEPYQGNYRVRHGYYEKNPLPAESKPNLIREDGTLEYVHRWEELIGTMCAAGFFIEALSEPMHAKRGAEAGSFGHRSTKIPPYVRIKARKAGLVGGSNNEPLIIV